MISPTPPPPRPSLLSANPPTPRSGEWKGGGTYRRKLSLGKLRNPFRGAGGWGTPVVTIGPRGCSFRCTITRFPAPGPSRASRIWESGNSASLASRNFAPEHHSEPQHELLRASHSRFRSATALSHASEKASPKTDPEGDLCTEPGASEGLSTASGASPGTSRLRLFFGVGGSGRSPLESADPGCGVWVGRRVEGLRGRVFFSC